VTGPSSDAVLPASELRAAEGVLARAWDEPVTALGAEAIWDRSHVVRLSLDTGRTAVLKRRRDQAHRRSWQAFDVELAALDYLNAMPVPVAPRLLGADSDAGILLIEDLGEGASLADSLLAGGRERAQAELIAYAQALGSMHAWSLGRGGRAGRSAGPARSRHRAGGALAGRHPAEHAGLPLGGRRPGPRRRWRGG
jgi:hypothetical protein